MTDDALLAKVTGALIAYGSHAGAQANPVDTAQKIIGMVRGSAEFTMRHFARPFRITAPGWPDLDGRHGTQLPSGICVLDAIDSYGIFLATSLEHLDLPDGAAVEWADPTGSST